jgi:hypothetical protein
MTCARARGLWRQPAPRSLVRSDLLVATGAKVDEALGKTAPAVDLGEQFGDPKTRQHTRRAMFQSGRERQWSRAATNRGARQPMLTVRPEIGPYLLPITALAIQPSPGAKLRGGTQREGSNPHFSRTVRNAHGVPIRRPPDRG